MIHRLLQGALRRAAGLVLRHAGTIVLLAVLLTAVAAWLTATKLRVINDTSNLIRADSEANKDYLAYAKEFEADDEYVVVIRSDNLERNRDAARWIGARMEGMQPGIRRVMYRLDFSKISDHFLLFLNEDELKNVEQEVGGYATQMRQANVRLDLNSMLDETDRMFNDKYLRKKENWKEFKPFVDRFVDMLNQLADSIEAKPEKKALAQNASGRGRKAAPAKRAVSNEASSHVQDQLQDIDRTLAEHEFPGLQGGKILLVSAVPGPIDDPERPYGKTTEDLRKLLAEARAAFPGVEFGLTGLPVLSDDELQMSSADSVHAGLVAFVLVVTLMIVGYRARTRPFVAIGVLLMAVCWSLGFTVLSVGHLNIISQAFVAMVIGLGIDFGIQIMGRYEEELGRGRNLGEALEAAIGQTGAAVVTGG
ncbi:MAG TPA: MMPL family transporter, partial [Candidatus Methylacidiphilales bacterium]